MLLLSCTRMEKHAATARTGESQLKQMKIMKYKSLESFMQAKEKGRLDEVVVIVDNDSVKAYDKKLNCVYDFGEAGPELVLVSILRRIGFNVEVP